MAERKMVRGEQQVALDGQTYTFRRVELPDGRVVYGVFSVDKGRWHSGPFPLRREAKRHWNRLLGVFSEEAARA